jgi:hypothetical protein
MPDLSSPCSKTTFDYRRHFMSLAGAIIVLAGVSRTPFYENLVFACAVNGALHAGALIASLRVSATVHRKLLFAAIASGLSIMSMYVGIVALVALSILPDSERLPAVVAIGAMTGAITYGSLIRIFWIRGIRPRAILGLATLCAMAALAGYLLKLKFDWPGMWWLAAIWWLAFSISLKFLDVPPLPKRALSSLA